LPDLGLHLLLVFLAVSCAACVAARVAARVAVVVAVAVAARVAVAVARLLCMTSSADAAAVRRTPSPSPSAVAPLLRGSAALAHRVFLSIPWAGWCLPALQRLIGRD